MLNYNIGSNHILLAITLFWSGKRGYRIGAKKRCRTRGIMHVQKSKERQCTIFLFAEGLAGLVRQSVKANLLSGIKVGSKEVEVSFLQFADDTLFFYEESWSKMVTMKSILRGFELASGLKINFHKSKLAGINVQSNNLLCYSKGLNCNQMGTPFKYLGLEVGGNSRKKSFWEPVVNKLKTRLSVWKGRFLSMAGKICVIKSVFTAIPLFYLSVFKASESVYKSIISIQRRFLWGWGKEKIPISWVSWENLCKPKEEGGLGLKDIRKFNFAILAKWRWRFMSQERGKWKDVLESKYGAELEGLHLPVKYQSWWWRDIVKMCMEGGGDGWFQEEVRWKLGRGDKVRFWEDVRIGDSSLKSLFHRLFSLSVNQVQKVEDVGEWEGTYWRWRLEWRRDRFEWETELEENLLDYILRANVNKNISDIRVWGEEELDKYSVNIAYNHLAKRPGATHHYAFEYLWKAKAFPNVLMTAWRPFLNRIPTRVSLSRKGVQMNSIVCVLCQDKEESCHHLFI